jgi:tetratricopeptide (TPR) repeat protein
LNYTTLASLARQLGDVDKLQYAAEEAVRWDPNNYQTRLLMAEAYLALGEREQAVREAEVALELFPSSTVAASTLSRALGPRSGTAVKRRMRKTTTERKRSVEALIDMERAMAEAGLLEKAQRKLLTAIRRAGGKCADCHQELAMLYEKMGRYPDAIAQWERFIEQAPERAAADQIKARIEELRQKNSSGQ